MALRVLGVKLAVPHERIGILEDEHVWSQDKKLKFGHGN